MSAFSYDKQYHSFLLDSSLMFLIPDTTTNMSCFTEQSIYNIHHPFYDQADLKVEILPSVNTSTNSTCNNDTQHHQVTNPMEKTKNNFRQSHSKLKGKKPWKETSSSNIDKGCISMRSEKKLNNKKRSRRSGDNDNKKKKSISEEKESNGAVTEYVHVRARRGQATDSHSLAERVRREKISKRMKLLQALVPGCDKVTSKALMLDEIINYVQSLKNQVEFLSLKVATVDPILYAYGMNVDEFMTKPERTTCSLEATNETDVQQQNCTQGQATNNIFNTSSGYSLIEQQNHTQATNNIFSTYGDYSVIDESTLLQLQQAQMSNFMSQSQSDTGNINEQLLWNVDEQIPRTIYHSGFANNL
ncbi:uncharacterized protein LOC141661535 isoform X2 [Apium graveolens]|uniref:uncharacterized protein LOC141661535 isoform X2 n=1 Tax=Apium graveolens TaxID=4045 RepID=UPI003D7B8211